MGSFCKTSIGWGMEGIAVTSYPHTRSTCDEMEAKCSFRRTTSQEPMFLLDMPM